MTHLRPALVLVVLFTILTGLAFPLAFTGVATAVVPNLSNGSLIERNGHVIGSALLGQNFTDNRWFHPRESATTDTDPKDPTKTISVPYDASSSGASNLAPTSKALVDRVAGDVKALGGGPVPEDLVTTSASGLDPDISPEAAQFQVPRVAAARHLPEAALTALVGEQTQGRFLGIFGQPRVNVLALNLALEDAATRATAQK
jgi:potassium-transporting ATPase KdpC subunit